MLYDSECWVMKKQHAHKITTVEMMMFRWMSGGKTKKCNIEMKAGHNLCVAPIEDQMRKRTGYDGLAT